MRLKYGPHRRGQKVVTFEIKREFWSLPVMRFEAFMAAIDTGEPVDPEVFGARRLRARPAVLDRRIRVATP